MKLHFFEITLTYELMTTTKQNNIHRTRQDNCPELLANGLC